MTKLAAIFAVVLALAPAACNSSGERALGGAAIGGLAGAAIGGVATGRASGALVGGALGAAGGAVVGAATTPQPAPEPLLDEEAPPPRPVASRPAPPRAPGAQGSAPTPTAWDKPICRYGTYTVRGQEYCKP
jgi:hypothetical protein